MFMKPTHVYVKFPHVFTATKLSKSLPEWNQLFVWFSPCCYLTIRGGAVSLFKNTTL